MHIVSWNKELETGIEILDEQHRSFLIKSNKFVIKSLSLNGAEAALEELEYLKDYLFYHFQTEESFMVDSEYPEYGDHQAEHKRLEFQVKEMSILLEEIGNDDRQEALERFSGFINEWVVNHIMNLDLKFAKYHREKTIVTPT